MGARREARLQRRRLARVAGVVALLCGTPLGFSIAESRRPLYHQRILVSAHSRQRENSPSQQSQSTRAR